MTLLLKVSYLRTEKSMGNEIYYGNFYGNHDGYDGAVFGIYGISATLKHNGEEILVWS